MTKTLLNLLSITLPLSVERGGGTYSRGEGYVEFWLIGGGLFEAGA